jgi:glycosyltransferase involved in cell wall biosynthesis
MEIVMADDGIAFDGRVKDEKPLGGAETAFAELAEALAARGHRVTAYTRSAAALDWKGVRWLPLDSGLPTRADLYIANRSWRLIGGCRGAARALFWLHNPAGYLLKWRYQWRLLRRRPVLVFLGPHHRSTYPAWAFSGGRAVIPYGISAPFLVATERPPPPPRAVFLSNPQRSLDWLLDIWGTAIHKAVPHAELHIFGGATVYGALGAAQKDRSAAVIERARAMAGDGVVLRGALGKSELAHELGQARLLLYRGDEGETFCNAAAEPQAMGVPGVVGDIACMAERIRDNETGFVVQAADDFGAAAVRLLTDDGLWREYHRNCLRFQRSWTWADAAGAFERLARPDP